MGLTEDEKKKLAELRKESYFKLSREDKERLKQLKIKEDVKKPRRKVQSVTSKSNTTSASTSTSISRPSRTSSSTKSTKKNSSGSRGSRGSRGSSGSSGFYEPNYILYPEDKLKKVFNDLKSKNKKNGVLSEREEKKFKEALSELLRRKINPEEIKEIERDFKQKDDVKLTEQDMKDNIEAFRLYNNTQVIYDVGYEEAVKLVGEMSQSQIAYLSSPNVIYKKIMFSIDKKHVGFIHYFGYYSVFLKIDKRKKKDNVVFKCFIFKNNYYKVNKITEDIITNSNIKKADMEKLNEKNLISNYKYKYSKADIVKKVAGKIDLEPLKIIKNLVPEYKKSREYKGKEKYTKPTTLVQTVERRKSSKSSSASSKGKEKKKYFFF